MISPPLTAFLPPPAPVTFKASPDRADACGNTPLMWACEANAEGVAELLLNARACPRRVNMAGDAALNIALKHAQAKEYRATGTPLVGLLTRHTAMTAPALLQRRVELRGLSGRPELNGCRGVAVSFDPKTGRYGVQLDGKGREKVALRPATLRALGEEEEEEDLAAATMALPVSSLGVSVGEGEPLAAFGDDSGRELDDGVNDEIVIRAGRDALQRLMRGDDDDDGSGGGGGGAGGGAGGGSGGGGGGDGVGDGSDSNPAKDVNTAAGAATAAAVASAAEPMALTSAGGKPIAEAVVRFQAEVDALETAWKAAASSVDAACADAPGGMERSPAPAGARTDSTHADSPDGAMAARAGGVRSGSPGGRVSVVSQKQREEVLDLLRSIPSTRGGGANSGIGISGGSGGGGSVVVGGGSGSGSGLPRVPRVVAHVDEWIQRANSIVIEQQMQMHAVSAHAQRAAAACLAEGSRLAHDLLQKQVRLPPNFPVVPP